MSNRSATLVTGGVRRCWWCGTDPLYMRYHDREWGVPVRRDRDLFAKLVLDGFQAGLSWITVLRKREAFDEAFCNWNPERIARFTARDEARLLRNERIIRSRAKVRGAIDNARAYLSVMERGPSGAFRDLLWGHVGHEPIVHRFRVRSQVPPRARASMAMARTLRSSGFSFCGPTICYAFMQAVGMVNDHMVDCHRHRVLA